MNHYCVEIKEKEFICHLYRVEELSEDDIINIYGLNDPDVEWYSIHKLRD